MTEDLLEQHADGVVTLTMNRADRLNALSDAMVAALVEALPRLGADPAVGAIILTGAGRGFCAGGDVKTMAGRHDATFEQRLEALRAMQLVARLLYTTPKVIIGMVNGVAAGAGMAIALACDLRLAAASARFATAFGGIGFSGDFGINWSLTRLVGGARARELMFLGEMLDAAAALRLGLVTRCVPDADLLAETTSLARRIAAGPRVAFGYMKRNLNAAATEPLDAVLELEAMHQIRASCTEDHQEARTAFVEKRPPVFRGR